MKNIVFDCDGTLVSSHGALLKSLQQLVSEERGEQVSMQEILRGYDADMLRCASNFNLDISNPQRLLQRWAQLSQIHAHAAVYDGLAPVLQTLEDRGARLLVWTGRDRASTLEILRRAGILRYFEELCCADDTTPKPHPAGLARLLDGENKNECIHIGDSYTDIQGAHEYGIKAIGALWGEHTDKKSFGPYTPDFWCDHPKQLLQILE